MHRENFGERMGVELTFSTPLDAQQNGAAESCMRTIRVRRGVPMISTAAPASEDGTIRRKDWKLKMRHKEIADKRKDARYSTIEVGDKVFVSRPSKLKGQTNFDPTEFTVVRKKHGTLDLLIPRSAS